MEYKATKGDFEEFHGSSNYTSASFALIWCDNIFPKVSVAFSTEKKNLTDINL